MGFRVLNTQGETGEQWTKVIAALPPEKQDIHFLPEYGRIYERTYGYISHLALFQEGSHFVVQPFVRRQLNHLPFLKDQHIDEPYYDISNPYGYGGPICSVSDDAEAIGYYRNFDRHFSAYCREQKIASEFTSLHPLLGNHCLIAGAGNPVLERRKEIVYLDLAVSENELWRGINRGHRSSINKARKGGVHVEKVPVDDGNLAIFKRLFYQTMRRNEATDRWYFPENYFRHCLDSLGQKRVSLFFASIDGIAVSAYLLIHDFFVVYYHFGGSDERFFEFRANNLLMYQVTLWARQSGFTRLHLGGGATSLPDDNLLRFKSGFTDLRAPLFTYGRIHYQQTYDYLCELKKAHERAMNESIVPSDYFPRYRR